VFWITTAITGGPPPRSPLSPHRIGPMRDCSRMRTPGSGASSPSSNVRFSPNPYGSSNARRRPRTARRRSPRAGRSPQTAAPRHSASARSRSRRGTWRRFGSINSCRLRLLEQRANWPPHFCPERGRARLRWSASIAWFKPPVRESREPVPGRRLVAGCAAPMACSLLARPSPRNSLARCRRRPSCAAYRDRR
jgi:hypothetical protein